MKRPRIEGDVYLAPDLARTPLVFRGRYLGHSRMLAPDECQAVHAATGAVTICDSRNAALAWIIDQENAHRKAQRARRG